MVTKSTSLTWEKTDSVLEAILLESSLIKKYQPYYNVDLKDDKSDYYVIFTDEEWPRVFLERARNLGTILTGNASNTGKIHSKFNYKIADSFGPFPEAGLIKEALRILRKIFPFRDKKANDPRHERFYAALGMSPTSSIENDKERYLANIKYLRTFFSGRKKILVKEIRRDMNAMAKMQKFEEADRLKKLIFALEHINDISLIKRENTMGESGFRMEAYDIAHLSGTSTVGAMVVSNDGVFDNSQYRKFKMSHDRNDDTANLAELISRRLNHPEWKFPDLIVVDGNDLQLAIAENILKARRIDIPVVGVTKNDKHKADKVIGNKALGDKYKNEIIALNAECHRFAIAYHRLRRGKALNL
jgi:excinuclease ABC subunit C